MLVRDVMNKDVKTIEPGSTIQEAALTMSKYSIGSLVVVKGGTLHGIVTERDIMSKAVAKSLDSSETKVSQVMSKSVVMITPEKEVEDAAEVMIEKGIKKLPVLKGDKLIGIISSMDVVASQPKFMEQMASVFLTTRSKKPVAG